MPIYDLNIAGGVNEPNPDAVQLHDSLAGGYVRLGCSIDAFVTDHRPKQAGRYDIDGLDVFAASIVGVPMNQRSWTQKAVRAIKGFTGDPEDEEGSESTPEAVEAPEAVLGAEKGIGGAILDSIAKAVVEHEGCDDCADEIAKGDLSAKQRKRLPAEEFACPEKRKYPINDAAHVRAALSRVADPANDQCGKAKILAAARRMGIGDHEQKSLMSDDELLAWAAANPAEVPEDFDDPEIAEKGLDTADGAALQRQDLEGSEDKCASCGHPEPCSCTDCPCEAAGHHASDTDNDGDDPAAGYDPDHDGKSIDSLVDSKVSLSDEPGTLAAIIKSATEGGQEAAPAASPEPAPSPDTEPTVPAAVRKAVYESEDVVSLFQHVKVLMKSIETRDDTIVSLSKSLSEATGERDRLAAENAEARQVIEKMLAMPLRAKTVGYVAGLDERLPDFLAPEVKKFLSDIAGERK